VDMPHDTGVHVHVKADLISTYSGSMRIVSCSQKCIHGGHFLYTTQSPRFAIISIERTKLVGQNSLEITRKHLEVSLSTAKVTASSAAGVRTLDG
jgi:hypothetical protein